MKIEFDKDMSPYTWLFIGLMIAFIVIGIIFG